jgi:glycosyltransferase involved in cell wall biosynthesis
VPTIAVVIPAYNAERTIGRMLEALAGQHPPPDEVIVVDNGSSDATAEIARGLHARVITVRGAGLVGRARNRGWEAATADVVVFLDADAIVGRDWAAGLQRALAEHPEAVVGCARRLVGRNGWSWVAQLQVGSPWIERGAPREVRALPSFCVAVRRDAPIRWAEAFGGEDGLFAVDALRAGLPLVFDPRFYAVHDEYRETFGELRRWQRRLTYGMARCRRVQREGWRKRIFWRFPIHYFALARLPLIHRRLRHDPQLRGMFLRYLPQMVVAEWTLGFSALRFVWRSPPVRPAPAPLRQSASRAPSA